MSFIKNGAVGKNSTTDTPTNTPVSSTTPAAPTAPAAPAAPAAPTAPTAPAAPTVPAAPPAPEQPPKAKTDEHAAAEAAAKKKATELLPEFRNAVSAAAAAGKTLRPKNKQGREVYLAEKRIDPDGKTVYTELPSGAPRWVQEQACACTRAKSGVLKACAIDDEPALVGKWLLILSAEKPVKYW